MQGNGVNYIENNRMGPSAKSTIQHFSGFVKFTRNKEKIRSLSFEDGAALLCVLSFNFAFVNLFSFYIFS